MPMGSVLQCPKDTGGYLPDLILTVILRFNGITFLGGLPADACGAEGIPDAGKNNGGPDRPAVLV